MNNSLPSYSQLIKKLQKQNPNVKELIKRFKLIPLRVSKVEESKHEKVNAITSPESDSK